MSGGDPRHVAEPAGREAQQGGILFGPGAGRVHERGGDEVRHMGHHGHQPVVVGGRQHQDVGPEAHHHALQPVEGPEVGGCRRGQHPDGPLEEIGVGAAEADLLGACHGVSPDEARVVRLFDDRGLDPTHVAHDEVGVSLILAKQTAGDLGDGGGRGRHECDLGLTIVTDCVDHLPLERLTDPALVGVEPGHVPSTPPQPQGDRPADQPGPDDERPTARAALSRGGHRGALGRRGGRRDGSRPATWRCARGAAP